MYVDTTLMCGVDSMDRGSMLDAKTVNNLRSLSLSDTFYATLVDSYSQSWIEDLASLQIAIERHDAEAIRVAAHRMKSASAVLGASKVAQRCAEIEQFGKSGELSSVAMLVRDLELAHQLTLRELRQL